MSCLNASPSPFRTLGLEINLFGHLAVAAVRALLRLERAGGGTVAAKRALLVETWLLWGLLRLSRELETLDHDIPARTREEKNDRARAMCLLSVLFTLLIVVRGVILRGASCPLVCGGYIRAPEQVLPAPAAPLPRPPAHARAAWYAHGLN